jgi:hypothetical protein
MVAAAPSPPVAGGHEPREPPVRSFATVESGRPERPRRRRQAAQGWLWPLLIAGIAIAVLIGVLAASLSGDAPPEEAVAGVSTFAEDPTRTPKPASGAKSTPTARVVRTSNQDTESAETGTARKARTPKATKTPRPTRTPESDD